MMFSVVIPVFNRLNVLREALDSVRAQRYTDYEIIVVDDGSTDGTPAYLQSLGDRVRVVTQHNRGPGSARNAGAAVAKGDYLAFLDSDDLWFPWTLECMARVIAERSPALIAARYLNADDDAAVNRVIEEPLDYQNFADYFASASHRFTVGAGMTVISRRAFAESGGFTTRVINGEDHDLILRIGTERGFAQVLQPITMAWRRHQHSETADLTKTVAGMKYLIEQESAGRYPGGAVRADERRRIITRHVRPVALRCAQVGRRAEGLDLYRSTFAWNAAAGHWAYLAALPVLSAWSLIRRAA